MSKASPQDSPGAPAHSEAPHPLPPGPRLITPAGHSRLMTERARLHADPAPSPGPAHTRRLALLDQLSERLEVVAPPTNTGSGRVHFGALVTVEDASGDLQSFRILGADEMEGALEAGALAPVTGHPTSAVSVRSSLR